ncbi:MAG: cadherin-like beta sandwich domain-containing protein, partial [Deltaproteobacteria bacterium]|nr:cadherin-like beta sandwich domain-containing protein [Deltaproteobacteria bacterium]
MQHLVLALVVMLTLLSGCTRLGFSENGLEERYDGGPRIVDSVGSGDAFQAPVDASPVDASPGMDTSVDTSPDTQVDTSVDTSPDTQVDTSVDTSPDTQVDTTLDRGPDTQVDTTFDRGPDTQVDTTLDRGPDVQVDMSLDMSPDVQVDTTLDMSLVVAPFLTQLVPSNGELSPLFSPTSQSYTLDVRFEVAAITFTPSVGVVATITVNGQVVNSGSASQSLTLGLGSNLVTMLVSANSLTRTYTVDVRRGSALLDYLKASNTDSEDNFGISVSLSGDTLAVGAPGDASSATGVHGDQANNTLAWSGAVYIFTREGSTWSQQAYLKASNTGEHDNFGSGVSLQGDTLAVGARGEGGDGTNQSDDSMPGSGAVYVFTRVGGVWSQQAYIKATVPGSYDAFGASVSLSGESLAVGAYSEDGGVPGVNGNETDNSLASSGAAYIFTRAGSVWTQQAYIKASDPGDSDLFATRLSL